MHSPVNLDPNRMQRQRSPWLVRLSLLVILGMVALFMLGRIRPKNLGVPNGQLAACPSSPNCVSTQALRAAQRIEPLRMNGAVAEVNAAALEILQDMPRTTLVTQDADYFYAECRSLVFRYIDDLELWFDQENQLIHARSAARVGLSDFGVNRERVETIFAQLTTAGVAE